MKPRSLIILALIAVAALAAGVVHASSTGSNTDPVRSTINSPVRLPAGSIVVNVPRQARGRLIPRGFLGLGIEYQTFPAYAGSDASAVDPVFEQLIRNLSPGQLPVIRFGGDTTDWSWWPIPGYRQPAGSYYRLDRHWTAVARAFTDSVSARLILGINFEANSARVARTMAHKLVSGLGQASIAALELGNEPEVYNYIPWYFRNGQPVPGRPPGWNFDTFSGEYARIAPALPGTLAGPATEGYSWVAQWPRFLATEPRVQIATGHLYPLQACSNASSPTFPTPSHLMTDLATTGLMPNLRAYVGIAHAQHRPLRIDEMNATPCPRDAQNLLSFSEALWALQILFDMASAGTDGVNMQTTAGGTDHIFTFKRAHGRWLATVEPEYYGLLMFAQAAPLGSRLIRLSLPGASPVHVWGTQATDRSVRVVMLNKSGSWHPVALRLAGALAAARLELLRAPGIGARFRVRLGGQTFGRETASGLLAGPSKDVGLLPARGRYVVRLPPWSAALLTIPPGA